MPQLNPAPWLLILLFSWFVFLMIALPKITKHDLIGEPAPKTIKTHDSTKWFWPWH
uniref:ATP synthase complex subunit 8 n=1 Tax=Papyrocranus congoensis TaxID=311468 RepID=C4IX83_PAPCN|nr:ATP synthase F0 subunit 8 [Papyrocranus congoensis]BAH58965.1 ATPase subunits 8 [Papyrocranus congoensis]